MPTDRKDPAYSFIKEWDRNDRYLQMLGVASKLSRLFSENDIPYIDYRLVENLFCRYFNAINDARLCTAYDARIGNTGIGIKTFILGSNHKTEKIAEFNQLRDELNKYKGLELARHLALFRNDRLNFAIRTYDITDSWYHIVGRTKDQLAIFNVPYEPIDIDGISKVTEKKRGNLSFSDGKNEYSFNNSKSVLMMQFVTPPNPLILPIDILTDPYSLLEQLVRDIPASASENGKEKVVGKENYVILPLYSSISKKKTVPERSGLNQWNAKGRPRNPNEVYIPIPKSIHKKVPSFFPGRDVPFILELPNGKSISAKVCQDNSKALMSNPNSALGEWLLRDILLIKEGELVTMKDLDRFGIDSVKLVKSPLLSEDGKLRYKLFFQSNHYESYEKFIAKE